MRLTTEFFFLLKIVYEFPHDFFFQKEKSESLVVVYGIQNNRRRIVMEMKQKSKGILQFDNPEEREVK